MLDKPTRLTIILGLVAVGIFIAECALFHFPFATGLDVLLLVWFTVVIGLIVVLSLKESFSLELSAHGILSLGCALGFGVFPGLLSLRHVFGFDHLESPFPTIIDGVIAALVALLLTTLKRTPRVEYKKLFIATNDLWIFAIGALVLFAAYNLQQFHYSADGSIITRGLFGVDIPFLAGEVHGIRNFGTLRDLHQMGQPWQYHDWTYQLLALLPRDRTLGDLAFAAPLVGYVMLALSIFTLSLRLTGSKHISYVAVALCFLVSGLEGGELSSYALSPSFVFGSMIAINILLVFDLRIKAARKKDVNRKTILMLSGMFAMLLLELSQTKLSTYLIVTGAFLLLGFMGLAFARGKKQVVTEIVLGCMLTLAFVLCQSVGTNKLMPSGDFLVGAPLLGYANHVASLLHIPVSTINPVTRGLALRGQSIFIIPFFVFHFLRFALLDPKILSALIMLGVYRARLWNESHELAWVLVLMIFIGFLLPVLYSPAWYPLALSFYTPMVSVQASLLLVVVGFGMFLQNKVTWSLKICRGLIGLVCLMGVALQGYAIIKEDAAKPLVVSASFVQAMNYLQTHAKDTDIIATHHFDIDSRGDESYYWYSALSGRRVISEGAKYGALLGAVADTNTEKGLHHVFAAEALLQKRRTLLDTIFSSSDSIRVSAAIAESGVAFIVEEKRSDASFSEAHSSLFGLIVFESGSYRIFKPLQAKRIELLD